MSDRSLDRNGFGNRSRPISCRAASEMSGAPVYGKRTTATLSIVVAAFHIAVGLPVYAEEFAVADLGVVERRARVLGYAVSAGTRRYPSRLLISFAGSDGTWTVDLEDGTSQRVRSPGFDNDYLQWPSFIAADGKVYTSCGRGGLSVFDPTTNACRVIRPIPDARWLRGMAIGPEGGVYVSDYPTGSAAKYDPRTGKVTRFGRQGGPFTIKHVYGYSVGSDGRYVYTAVGKIPWYVSAYDTRTGKQENLFRFEPTDHPEVHQRGDAVFLDVSHGSAKPGQPKHTRFRLSDGRAEPVDSIPRFDDSYVPGSERVQPEFAPLGRSLPIQAGRAAIRFRKPGQPWRTASLAVSGTDMIVERLTATVDGRLLISTGPYGNVHRFDPRTKTFVSLGSPAAKHVYDLLQVEGRVYFCGYPNGILGAFEQTGGSIIGNWHDNLGSVHTVFLVQGADGRIYSGNHNERASTGGGLGWYDPRSGKFGGNRFPNDDCEFLTTALSGRIIVYASDFSHDPTHPEIKPRSGKLLLYDTTEQKIVRELSPLSDGSAGVLVETKPGLLLGVGRHNKLPMMYTVDVAAGRVVHRKPLSARAKRLITCGPDGKVYLFLGEMLVRVDPRTLKEQSLLRTTPGRMVFLGTDLYIGGGPTLRRVANVAAGK